MLRHKKPLYKHLGSLVINDLLIKNTKIITNATFGTVDYTNGEVMLGYTSPVTFVNTILPNSVIQIRALPFGQDVVAKQSVYLELDSDSSKITSLVDTNVLSS